MPETWTVDSTAVRISNLLIIIIVTPISFPISSHVFETTAQLICSLSVTSLKNYAYRTQWRKNRTRSLFSRSSGRKVFIHKALVFRNTTVTNGRCVTARPGWLFFNGCVSYVTASLLLPCVCVSLNNTRQA